MDLPSGEGEPVGHHGSSGPATAASEGLGRKYRFYGSIRGLGFRGLGFLSGLGLRFREIWALEKGVYM